ncbi:DCC1-like thiol-disulfide oxidoreductase family protein [Pararhizobium sp. BT-229]|uniref:thiol-disulfide oxidoreductase DCC family protein n=1 Tax=Pararhizobium sp. BT-229 TaxID=2986923 RepID=UPI0021F754A2|nr:DCC1-like thiol-disulfide oxidoreductase family protein [Pararhizobium sp. BT-229]MCV9964114.1 DCC1-like thiol-disulfide oxidoreductase family protein [Pararhizobium sp. BT-229]
MTPFSYRTDPAVPSFLEDKPIIVFDGECVFCSGWVTFALRTDRRRRYRFLTAQSELGAALYRHYGLDDRDYETNILVEDGVAHFRSRGSIRMIAGLGFPWTLVRALSIIPAPLADRLYEFVARNRFRIAGRKSSCYVPSAEDRARFLSI